MNVRISIARLESTIAERGLYRYRRASLFFVVLAACLGFDGPASAQAESEGEPHWSDRLSLSGDLRYRIESIDAEGEDLRHRHRVRARLALEAEVMPGLDATVGLGTGGEDDPVSNNQSLGGGFSSKPIWLDLAFLDYGPEFAPGLHLVAGKMKNPFKSVGRTELVWDSDLTPEGLSLRYEPTFGIVAPFMRGGVFWVEERSSEEDSLMAGAQAGLKVDLADDAFYVLAGGRYVDHVNMQGSETYWDAEDSFGNSATPDVDGTLSYDHDYDLAGGFLELGGKVAGMRWAVFGDFVRNVAISEDNTGWLAGGSIGNCRDALDICTRYTYRRVEHDAVVGIFADSDFVGGGTDGKGHEVNLGVQLATPVRAGVSYFYNERNLDDEQNYQRVQMDLSGKF